MKSFSRYLTEGKNAITFSFGRMNPPTIGHEKLLDKMKSVAGSNPYRMFLSQSHDTKKNPLSYDDKIKWSRKLFPKHGRSIIKDNKLINVFDIATKLYNEGFTDITMVVGSDRIKEFDILLKKYNDVKGRHGYYNFKSIKVVSAGDRDPDAEGVTGMSASKMRAAAAENDFNSFSKGLTRSLSNKDSKVLFNTVRKGMGLKESFSYSNHVEFDSVSDIREKYVNEELFIPGDMVKDKNGVYEVVFCGANYLIVENEDGERKRTWLNAVTKIEEKTDRWYKEKPEWGTPEASNKAKEMTPGEKEEKQKLLKKIREAVHSSAHVALYKRQAREREIRNRQHAIEKKRDAEQNEREADAYSDRHNRKIKDPKKRQAAMKRTRISNNTKAF